MACDQDKSQGNAELGAVFGSLTRRSVLKGAGALIVSVGLPSVFAGTAEAQSGPQAGAEAANSRPPLMPDQLDSWIRIAEDGSVTTFYGKMDPGQGVDVAIAQIVAEELDVPFERVAVVLGDTARTVNQGGASGSTGVQRAGTALRNAAAEARRVLVELASQRLNVPADQLTVADGVVSAGTDPRKRISYGELLAGGYFNHHINWNGTYGNDLQLTAQAKPKSPDQYKIVGKPIPRRDIPGKVLGRTQFVTEVRVPGMMHGRLVLPPVAGSVPVSVDERSISHIRGARVVHVKDFLGVVAESEWDAIRAARDLKVTWSKTAPPFPRQSDLYDYIRRTPAHTREAPVNIGQTPLALSQAARTILAEYEWPFQSHSSMGPACAVADVRPDRATVWTGTQKPHYARDGVAALLGLPPERVHGIWVIGPGCYGRNDAGDIAISAAVLSKAVGRPVRLQSTRHEATGWDPKGPASVHFAQAGFDSAGNVVAWQFNSKGFSRLDVYNNESHLKDTLPGHLLGVELMPGHAFNVPAESYGFPNKLLAWETIPPLLERASPLRTAHLRDPVGPQIHFASEQFIDEMAAAVGADPVEFRLKHLKAARDIAAVQAAAERAGWKPRRSLPKRDGGTSTVSGRGIAYAQRNGAVAVVIADIEVDRATGRIWARKFTVAHDCGLMVNPDGIRHVVEANMVQATSRTLLEEVKFDQSNVTSVDWKTYPILDAMEAPESVDVVLIDRKDVPAAGAGEASSRPTPAAIANAFYDATGVRIRRAPLTPERVKEALNRA